MSRLRAIAAVAALALLLAAPTVPVASARPIVPDLCSSFACLHPAVANVSVTFTNAQAIATGTFDEQWVLPSSTYAAYLNANVTNFYVSYPNGTLIPTWVETNASNASATTIVWERLFNIPATSSVTVFVDIAAKTPLMAIGGPVGEAPQLTATYGAFDDGFKVFDHYWNWSGTTNPTGWTHSASVTVTVNNGVTLASTAAGQTYVSPFTLAKGSGWGDRLRVIQTAGTNLMIFYLNTNGASDWAGLSGAVSQGRVCGATPVNGPTLINANYTFRETTWATGEATYLNRSVITSSGTPCMAAPSQAQFYLDNAMSEKVSWLDYRVSPPNGVMPTATLGTLATPPPPTWAAVVWLTPTNVSLQWNAGSAGAINYTLRSGPTCAAPNRTFQTGGANTSFIFHGVAGGVQTCLTVQEFTSTNVSAPSAATRVVPPSIVVPPVTVNPTPVNVSVALPWIQLAIVDVLLTVVVLLVAAKINRDRGGREVVEVGTTKSADDLTDAEIERANMYTAGAGQGDENLYAAPRRKP